MDEDTEAPYKQAIGSLIYVMYNQRPDIAYVFRVLSSFSETPEKGVFSYLKSIPNLSIRFHGNSNQQDTLECYVDSDKGVTKTPEHPQLDTLFYLIVVQ